MSPIDPRFMPPMVHDRLNHFFGAFMTVRQFKWGYGTKEASGNFPPRQWAGDAVAIKPRPQVLTPQGGAFQGTGGRVDYRLNRRGG